MNPAIADTPNFRDGTRFLILRLRSSLVGSSKVNIIKQKYMALADTVTFMIRTQKNHRNDS